MSAPVRRRRGKMNNAFDASSDEHLDADTRALLERRSRWLGPAYRLFYKHPLTVTRAQGVFLYDREGKEYLDAYNNVVSVGHAHPKVVQAVHQQMQTLCTHTRYLQEGILNYAEDLLSTFSGGIGRAGHLMLTCTGSEANDLALRIAKYHTGKRGVIVTAEAYHGNSAVVAGISPSLGENSPLGTWVRCVPAPDSYRHAPGNLGAWLADQVAQQIKDLERHGDGLAAFIVDSIFSSDGIYAQPKNVLAPVAAVVRAAGGLFIADEVQCGFMRTGEAMWGHQRHGINPDIVSMGKPMGNGFPVAGIAVVPEVVEEFGNDVRYFNTFGGNTVAVAAAQATLNVLREEKLLENANAVGRVLTAGLKSLAADHPCIGDVRGAGLFVGVEIVKDPDSKAPDTAAASAIVNGLRDRHVLISITGAHSNILKIRPPLTFSTAHAGRLLGELDSTLKAERH
jgi:4-aminobutyrate aminotransferase-like enzyme